MRWSNYDERKKEFSTVRQKNGGGNCFVPYTDKEPFKLETRTDKVRTLFFPDGENNFVGRIQETNTWICNASGVAVFDFPDDRTVDDYLKKNGLYPSSTYFFFVHSPDIFQKMNLKAVSLPEQKACQHLKRGHP